MLACSTHGRVPSALRTRSGQPRAQNMPGTLSVTSVGVGGVGLDLLQPHSEPPTVESSKATRTKKRMDEPSFRAGSALRRNDFALEPLLADHCQHRLGRDTSWIVADMEQIVLQLDFNGLDTREP